MGSAVKKTAGAFSGGLIGDDVYGLDPWGTTAASKAAKKSAAQQTAAGNAAIAEQRQAYQDVLPGLSQFMHPSYQQAFQNPGQYQKDMGYSPQREQQKAIAAKQGRGNSKFGGKQRGGFTGAMQKAMNKKYPGRKGQAGWSEQDQQNQMANTRAQQAQGFGYGMDPMSQLNASSGAAGPEAQQAWYDNFQEDPGTQWLRQQGMQGMSNANSSTGGLGGGSRLKALSRFNQGLANQGIGDRLSQLGSLASTNIGLAQGLGNLRTGLGDASAQSANNLGQIQANNTITQGNLKGNQMKNLIGLGGAVGGFM